MLPVGDGEYSEMCQPVLNKVRLQEKQLNQQKKFSNFILT